MKEDVALFLENIRENTQYTSYQANRIMESISQIKTNPITQMSVLTCNNNYTDSSDFKILGKLDESIIDYILIAYLFIAVVIPIIIVIFFSKYNI